jgi:hypothetical protein
MAHRNLGVLGIAALVGVTLFVLLEVRALWPRFYPALRNIGFVLYCVGFGLSILVGVLAR